MSSKVQLIVDTDGCVDDARALCIALTQRHRCNVVAITTVFGSTDVDQVVANVSRVRRVTKRFDVPIYKGAAGPLKVDTKQYPATFFFGSDGLGGVPDVEPVLTPGDRESCVKGETAAEALVRLAREHPQTLTLVSIGPLTNVALALQKDDDFATNLKDMIFLGGNMWGVGNTLAGASAEFNFHCDPEAAALVVERMTCSLTCVPWELFSLDGPHRNVEEETDFDAHLMSNTPVSRFLRNITEHGRQFLVKAGKEFRYCDEIAIAAAIDRRVVAEHKLLPAAVELQGSLTRGQMVIDWFTEFHRIPSDTEQESHKLTFVTSYDVAIVNGMMMEAVQLLDNYNSSDI